MSAFPSTTASNDRARYGSLDAVRGFGCIVIATVHICMLLPAEQLYGLRWMYETPLRIIINGEAAVIVFYVLSGFVLSLSYYGPKPPSYPRFLWRRICRLYVPFVVIMLLVFVLYEFYDPAIADELGALVGIGGQTQTSLPSLLLLALTLPGTMDGVQLDPPIWTLAHEMRLSLLFPLLVWLGRKSALIPLALAVLVYGLAMWAVPRYGDFLTFPSQTQSLPATFLATLFFIPCFLLGIALARGGKPLLDFAERLPWPVRIVGWLACFACFNLFNDFYELGGILHVDYFLRIACYGVAAAVAVLLLLTSAYAETLPLLVPLRRLGAMSYSFYLVHFPVLYVMRTAFEDSPLPPWAVIILFLAVTLVLAFILYRWVELPAMGWGRSLLRKRASAA